jgi:carbamoyltransferase
LEETVLHTLDYLHGVTKMENLCTAGGVGLNSVMNGRIYNDSPFKNMYVQPASYDAGSALGSALHIHHQVLGFSRNGFVMDSAYFGPEYTDEEIRQELELCNLKYTYHEDAPKIAAKLLNEGNIIGWFQGKMEWGPRALGNRSILADSRDADMKDKLNSRVKFRESFRPFAVSVLEERAHEYFKCKGSFPFMLFVFDVIPEVKEKIPAVTHVDGTSRIQTVSQKANPKYYKLIEEFDKITGVPALLNTSFNVNGEPIIATPKEAIRCFFSTGMDFLIMGNYMLTKKDLAGNNIV